MSRPSRLSIEYRGFTPKLKRPKSEVGHSYSSKAEVMNERNFTSTAHTTSALVIMYNCNLTSDFYSGNAFLRRTVMELFRMAIVQILCNVHENILLMPAF
jgi:hypothetical protein